MDSRINLTYREADTGPYYAALRSLYKKWKFLKEHFYKYYMYSKS